MCVREKRRERQTDRERETEKERERETESLPIHQTKLRGSTQFML